MILLFIAALFAACYFLLQLFYLVHWLRAPSITTPDSFTPTLPVSVIVVAQNEEDSVGNCIHSILKQNYPSSLVEIIVVNDRSVDRTVELIQQINAPNLTLLHLHEHPEFIHSPAFKKSGIELGVHHATADWTVMTDADCMVPPDWLRTIAFYKNTGDHVFIASPVVIRAENSPLQKMQQMENITLMVITAAGIRSKLHDIANGANMSFSKTVFEQVKGFEGNYQYASGDDMFLIEKMRGAYPDQIEYLKSKAAVASTQAKSNWSLLLRQRIRWADKNKGLMNWKIPFIWGFVAAYYVVLLFLMIIPTFSDVSYVPFLIILLVKWVADGMIVHAASQFFGIRYSVIEFVVLQFLYGYYLIRLGIEMLMGRKGDW